MATRYQYPAGAGLTGTKLEAEIAAAGLPAPTLVYREGPSITVVFADALTAPQLAALDAVAAAHTASAARQLRTLNAIFNDINALTGTQKANVWAFISGVDGGGVVRWRHSNRGDVWIAMRMSELVGAGALQTSLRVGAVAIYVREENTEFLVNPAFDPTINVSGTEPQA